MALTANAQEPSNQYWLAIPTPSLIASGGCVRPVLMVSFVSVSNHNASSSTVIASRAVSCATNIVRALSVSTQSKRVVLMGVELERDHRAWIEILMPSKRKKRRLVRDVRANIAGVLKNIASATVPESHARINATAVTVITVDRRQWGIATLRLQPRQRVPTNQQLQTKKLHLCLIQLIVLLCSLH